VSENWKIQVSPKLGNTLVNIRGESIEEFSANLKFFKENANHLAAAIAEIEAQYNLASGGITGTPTQQPPFVPQQRQYDNSYQQQAPASNGGAPVPPGPPPSCAHGQKKWMNGVKRDGGTYRPFWACNGPRGEQCR
jgi:hypothetical protein